MPISSGAIVVVQVASGQTAGNAAFSYKVVGVKYNWYQAPFIGKAYWIFILFLIALALAFTIVVCCPVFSIFCCAFLTSRSRKRKQTGKIKDSIKNQGITDDVTDAGFSGNGKRGGP